MGLVRAQVYTGLHRFTSTANKERERVRRVPTGFEFVMATDDDTIEYTPLRQKPGPRHILLFSFTEGHYTRSEFLPLLRVPLYVMDHKSQGTVTILEFVTV